MKEEEMMVNVPYDDFVDYICAMTKIQSIIGLLKSGVAYCSDDIKAILGIYKAEEAKDDASD